MYHKKVAMSPFGSSIKTDDFVDEGVPVIRGNNLTDQFVDEGYVFLRDALLSKITSGELRVPDAEKIVGRAT